MMLGALLGIFIDKLFFCDKWNIGFVVQTAENLIQTRQIKGKIIWLPEDVADYAADPFPVVIDDQVCVYYEELNFWKGKGQIMKITDMDFGSKQKVRGIAGSTVHLSYPYMFSSNDNLYCIPETSEEKQVNLYQVNKKEPSDFKKIRTILEGESFVDSSIIFFNNKYWLFTSISGVKGKLYIYFSEDLESDFNPHSLNPIAVSNSTSRSAGQLFIVGDKLYMPSQNPQVRYGGSIMINEITTITETEFEYTAGFELTPQLPYDKGLHTIGFAGKVVVVDGKRKVFSPLAPLKKIVRKIRNIYYPVKCRLTAII